MFNKVILIGNLGHSPDMHTFENGNKVAKLSLATSESYKNKDGEKKTITEWHNCVVYGKGAEIAEVFLDKGSKILFEGKIKSRSYEGREGVTKYITEIIGNFTMLGKEKTEDPAGKEKGKSTNPAEKPNGEIKRGDIETPVDGNKVQNEVEIIEDETDDLPF